MRPLRGPFAPLAVVMTGLLAVMWLASVTESSGRVRQGIEEPARVAVESTTLVCPEPSYGQVALATATSQSGRISAIKLAPNSARPFGDVPKEGRVWAHDAGQEGHPVSVRANGPVAAGLVAEQTGDTSSGLTSTRCVGPESAAWFVGDGLTFGRSVRLYLTNADETPATVDVAAFGPNGPMDPAGGHGITVAPGTRESLSLGELAGDARLVALRVRTSVGRVAAAVYTKTVRGSSTGVDWMPQTMPPRRDIVVPGMADGSGPRRLIIMVPGDRDARVKAQVVTGEGTYIPSGRQEIQVPAGSVVSVGLQDALSGKPAAVRLSANVPITASAVVEWDDDYAYTAVSPPLTAPALVADNRDGGLRSALLLSAPMRKGAVRITNLRLDGEEGTSRKVTVPGGRTVRVSLSGEERFGVEVDPEPGSGPVYGARMLYDDDEVTMLPLWSAPTMVTLPRVDNSVTAAIPQPRR